MPAKTAPSDGDLPPSRTTDKTTKAAAPADDHDSPWKEALEVYLPQALALLLPALHTTIDWSATPVFLDKELQAIALPGRKGRREADKLVRVCLRSGADLWLFVHIEVQRGIRGPAAQTAFARRMYEYHFLIQYYLRRRNQVGGHRDDHRPLPTAHDTLVLPRGAPPWVYSLAILTDGTGPETELVYTDRYLGHGAQFSFPVVHLDAWETRRETLERMAPTNPFAVFVLAQLEANRHPDKATRLAPKLRLMRQLGGYGYGRDEIQQIFRLVDWMIRLPPDLEPSYEQALAEMTQENEMTYVTTIERWGIKKGRAQGLQEGTQKGQADLLLRQIERRFGPVAEDVTERVRAGTPGQLELWALNILDASTLADVFRE